MRDIIKMSILIILRVVRYQF